MLNAMLLDRLCGFFRGSRFCGPILLYLGHPCGANLDPLGIPVCLLLTLLLHFFIVLYTLAFCHETTVLKPHPSQREEGAGHAATVELSP